MELGQPRQASKAERMELRLVGNQGHRLFHCRVGQARFERRPTIWKRREIMVGRRGEAPLVPPYILPNFKKELALVGNPGKFPKGVVFSTVDGALLQPYPGEM